MTVIVAHDTPPAIRGMLKRWFIEPQANVFVGTLNRRTRDKTLDYIKRNAADIALLIVLPKNASITRRLFIASSQDQGFSTSPEKYATTFSILGCWICVAGSSVNVWIYPP